jgi:hypothetical protein
LTSCISREVIKLVTKLDVESNRRLFDSEVDAAVVERNDS